EDALDNYRRAVRAHPRQPQVRLRLAQLAVRHDDLAEAEEHLEYLRRRGFKRPEVLLALAQLRGKQGDFGQERALLDELLAEAPDDGDALIERGRLAVQEGDPRAAVSDLPRAGELAPQDRPALALPADAPYTEGKAHGGGQ